MGLGERRKRRRGRRSFRRGRRSVKQRITEIIDVEDRISELSDDLLKQILSYVHCKVAVQTTVLSKRWRNLWTTLSCLNFEQPISDSHDVKFVRKFLENRDQQYVLTKLTIDCNHGGRKMLTTCLDHALSHNVEHLSIRNVDLVDYRWKISFACLKTLHLIGCRKLPMMDDWTLPNLTSLYLEVVHVGNKILGFENLKELTLVEYSWGIFGQTITINCPKLQSLTLDFEHRHTFDISAPSLYYLSYCSRNVPAFYVRDGFPCIKQVYIHIRKTFGDFFDYDSDRPYWNRRMKKFVMQDFISMLKAVNETPFLELSDETIEGLLMIYPKLSKYKHSSLSNLKYISLRGPGQFDMKPPRTADYVINYLLTNSPCAKIIRRL